MGSTQKVGSTGRFGSRYGVGIRRKLLKVEPLQLQRHTCPNCGSASVKRKSRGVFECRKCSHSFVGGAYIPQTLAGGIIHKMVSQKVFSGEASALLAKVAEPEAGAVGKAPQEERHHKKERKHKEEPAAESGGNDDGNSGEE